MNRLISLAISSAFRLLACIPLRLTGLLGAVMGWFLWVGNSRSKKITQENLRLCFPDKSADERRQIAKQRMKHLCMTALEFGSAWYWPPDKLVSHMALAEGVSLLDNAVAQGKGVILLAPHHGNWEALGPYVGSRHKLVCLYQPPKVQAVGDIVFKSRSRFCSALAPTSAKGVKTLLKALKRGEVVAILPDQVPSTGNGEYADFFGTPALTMTLVYNLIQRTDARVIVCYAKRINSEKHFQPVFKAPAPGIYSQDQHESVQALNQCIEQVVLECPEQYQWEYKRFKKQPDGKKPYKLI